MKKLQILSRHTSIADAVIAAKLDLSYNPKAAQERIESLDRGDRRRGIPAVSEVYLTNEGIFYVYVCDLILLNQFDPFHSIMSDTPFGWALIDSTNPDLINVSDGLLKNRKDVERLQKSLNKDLKERNAVIWAHKA